jgi:hypothetical protein
MKIPLLFFKVNKANLDEVDKDFSWLKFKIIKLSVALLKEHCRWFICPIPCFVVPIVIIFRQYNVLTFRANTGGKL